MGRRPFAHYAYADNNPISNSDPMGDRTWVRVDGNTRTIYIQTKVVVESEYLGTASLQTGFVKKYSDAIQKYWNNDGNGWQVTFDGGKPWQVYFTPDVAYGAEGVDKTDANIVTYTEGKNKEDLSSSTDPIRVIPAYSPPVYAVANLIKVTW